MLGTDDGLHRLRSGVRAPVLWQSTGVLEGLTERKEWNFSKSRTLIANEIQRTCCHWGR
jgi:hypothetical protein